MDTPDRLIRPAEASKILAVGRRTLRRYERAGKLKAIKLNARVTRYWLSHVMGLAQ